MSKFIDGFPSKVDEYEDLLTNNPIWMRPHQGRGLHFASKTCWIWASPGRCCAPPALSWDVRKTSPYSSYEKFDFEVPTRTENDVYARYRVRMEEMRQSARIIKQALEGMPAGPWQADAPHVVLPDREKMKTQMEALIYHFKIVTEGFRVPAGEVYQCVESPRGEIGYYVVSDGTSKPYRVHMRDAELRQPAGAAEDGRRHADRRFDRRRWAAWILCWEIRTDNDAFARSSKRSFAKMLTSYPPGRQRSAVIPMLMYAQDEVGSVTHGTDRRSGAALPA